MAHPSRETLPTDEVLIVGAGIAGLALAHGLRQTGRRVALFEHDAGLAARDQGYRIHLDAPANLALRALLPATVYGYFLSLSEPLSPTFAFCDERKRELVAFTEEPQGAGPDDGGRALDRFTLRQVLLTDLVGEIALGKRCTGVATTPGGATAYFADGTARSGGFLVGADGTGSRVARTLLGRDAARPTAAVAMIGRLPTTPAVRALLPAGRFDRLGIVLGPRGINLFLSERDPAAPTDAQLRADPATAPYLSATPEATVWSIFARREKVLPEGADPRDGAALRARALALTRGWHPDLRRLIALTEAADVSVTPIDSARGWGTWRTNPRATVLGDAIHAMAPLLGQGASVALRDARDLAAVLARTNDAGVPDTAALTAYERRMRRRAYPTVWGSKLLLDLDLAEGPPRALLKGALRLAGRLAAREGVAVA